MKIIGHHLQIEQLAADLETGNVAHAYLFAGPRHIGKFTVAKWFATELLSSGKSPEERIAVREQTGRLIHPDLLSLDALWIEGTCEDWAAIATTSNVSQHHRKKSGTKTDIISIDDIRALQDRLFETGSGRFRCCLIRSVERMQPVAANALLKILEEPPAGMVFLLTTQSLSLLLPTLVSRSRIMRFQRLPAQHLRPLLAGISDEQARFLLRLAQGAPGIIARLLDDPELLRRERLFFTQASSFWRSQSLGERLQLLEPLHERTEESDDFLLHLGLALRECVRTAPISWSTAFTELVRGQQTNAHRQLLAQKFMLDVTFPCPS